MVLIFDKGSIYMNCEASTADTYFLDVVLTPETHETRWTDFCSSFSKEIDLGDIASSNKLNDYNSLNKDLLFQVEPTWPHKPLAVCNSNTKGYKLVKSDNLNYCFGGTNEKIAVGGAPLDHPYKNKEKTSLGEIVSKILDTVEDRDSAVNTVEDLVDCKNNGFVLLISDFRKGTFIEYMPEKDKQGKLEVCDISGDYDVRTNFSLEHGFFWSDNWVPSTDMVTQKFIKGLNKYLVSKELESGNLAVKNHDLIMDLFNKGYQNEVIKFLSKNDLDSLDTEIVEYSRDASFYTLCTHPKIYATCTKQDMRTAVSLKFNKKGSRIIYGNPCHSKLHSKYEIKK